MKGKKNKSYKMPSSLQQILTEEERPVYEEYFNTPACKKVREKLTELFEKKVQGSYLITDKENKYDKPSWSEYQADAIGYRRALKELIKFLEEG